MEVHSWGSVWDALGFWQHLTLVALIYTCLIQAGFVVTYARRRRWQYHYVGRALMWKSATLTLILWLTLFDTFVTYPHQEPVAAGAFILLGVAITMQFVALLRVIHEGIPEAENHQRV